MEKIFNVNRRRFSDPSPHAFDRYPTESLQHWVPDFSAEETILNTGDDQLPNTLELLKHPEYQTALHQFAQEIQMENSAIDTSNFTDEQLADLVGNDNDLNNRFWSFYDSCKEQFEKNRSD